MDLRKAPESKNFEDKTGARVGLDLAKTMAAISLALGIEKKMPPLQGEPDVIDGYGNPIYDRQMRPYGFDKMLKELEREVLKKQTRKE